ncbi:unnamed protein product [Bursaphelenchus okinawaensis]|uniref:Uncharacterized protein n=1 Tax=Bursaphelenchus okinawaensis TaxID=465554 RepID=A0A811KU51_9BILA|nr:unnamed protein product [Bursaphelenchus okinawaensis]CAG9113253.1 unnamed protein product [Bursaphelenchus okinawaensis]
MVDGWSERSVVTKESVLKLLLSAITLVFQDLEGRYPGHALEATLKYREVYVLDSSIVFEYNAKFTYKDSKVSWEWQNPIVLIRSEDTSTTDITSNGYVFSLLGMNEYFVLGDHYYKTSLLSKNMIDMAIDGAIEDIEFVTDGFNMIFKRTKTSELATYDFTHQYRKICNGVEEEPIGFDESTFNLILKEGGDSYCTMSVYDSCSKKMVGKDSNLHKIPLYLARPGSKHLESQWYTLRHVAAFSPKSYGQISAGHLMKFQAIPLKKEVELCQVLPPPHYLLDYYPNHNPYVLRGGCHHGIRHHIWQCESAEGVEEEVYPRQQKENREEEVQIKQRQ